MLDASLYVYHLAVVFGPRAVVTLICLGLGSSPDHGLSPNPRMNPFCNSIIDVASLSQTSLRSTCSSTVGKILSFSRLHSTSPHFVGVTTSITRKTRASSWQHGNRAGQVAPADNAILDAHALTIAEMTAHFGLVSDSHGCVVPGQPQSSEE